MNENTELPEENKKELTSRQMISSRLKHASKDYKNVKLCMGGINSLNEFDNLEKHGSQKLTKHLN